MPAASPVAKGPLSFGSCRGTPPPLAGTTGLWQNGLLSRWSPSPPRDVKLEISYPHTPLSPPLATLLSPDLFTWPVPTFLLTQHCKASGCLQACTRWLSLPNASRKPCASQPLPVCLPGLTPPGPDPHMQATSCDCPSSASPCRSLVICTLTCLPPHGGVQVGFPTTFPASQMDGHLSQSTRCALWSQFPSFTHRFVDSSFFQCFLSTCVELAQAPGPRGEPESRFPGLRVRRLEGRCPFPAA